MLDLLMPLRCAVCQREGRCLCEGCEGALARLEKPYCSRCAEPGTAPMCERCAATPPAVDGIRAPYLFDGVVREMVYDLKYRNLRASAPELGQLLAGYHQTNPNYADVMVPVPLHKRAERERGYNQSKLLARELGKLTGTPMKSDIVRRTKNTPPQVSMKSYEERRENIERAFECVGDVAGQSLLVVVDVVTTGSTMSSCASALKAAGARSVWGLALARQAGG